MSWKKLELKTEDIGNRIDKVIAGLPEVHSRSRAHFLIDEQLVLINKKPCKMSHQIKETDLIEYQIPEVTETSLESYDFPLEIEYEDDDLLVINKPSGLVVHPSAGHQNDTLVNALVSKGFALSMKFGEDRPGIVHRLDKETSGLLVVAKNDQTHEALTTQFKNREIHRIYQALVFGVPKPADSVITSYLARHPTSRKRYATVLDHHRKRITVENSNVTTGKWAITNYTTLQTSHGLTLLQLKLGTGRTHQIRVHLSEVGHPIVGDSLYGAERKLAAVKPKTLQEDLKNLQRFYLHASELGFQHPTSKKDLYFKRNWPDEDLKKINAWGFRV